MLQCLWNTNSCRSELCKALLVHKRVSKSPALCMCLEASRQDILNMALDLLRMTWTRTCLITHCLKGLSSEPQIMRPALSYGVGCPNHWHFHGACMVPGLASECSSCYKVEQWGLTSKDFGVNCRRFKLIAFPTRRTKLLNIYCPRHCVDCMTSHKVDLSLKWTYT